MMVWYLCSVIILVLFSFVSTLSVQWRWRRMTSSLCSWRSCPTFTSLLTLWAGCGSSRCSRWTDCTPCRPLAATSDAANSPARLGFVVLAATSHTTKLKAASCSLLVCFEIWMDVWMSCLFAGGGSPEEAWPAGGDCPQRAGSQQASGEYRHIHYNGWLEGNCIVLNM